MNACHIFSVQKVALFFGIDSRNLYTFFPSGMRGACMKCCYLTEPFEISEPRNTAIGVSELHNMLQSTGFVAMNRRNIRSARETGNGLCIDRSTVLT